MNVVSIYLIHFNAPYPNGSRPQHYIGVARDGDIERRLVKHEKGLGSKVISLIQELGISWRVVKVWHNVPLALERRLKNRGSAKRICPACRGERVPAIL